MLINAITAMLVAINKNILVMVRSRMSLVLEVYIVACARDFNAMNRPEGEKNINDEGQLLRVVR